MDALLDMAPGPGEQLRFPGMNGPAFKRRDGARKDYLAFSQQVAHAPTAIRAPWTAAPGILQTRDIRSQHETKSSKGYLNPGYRALAEEAMDFPDHPVYGYQDIPDEGRAYDAGSHYGNLKFTLKGEVKDRTTILNGDSLTGTDKPAKPIPVRDVQRGGTRLPKDSDAWNETPDQQAKVEGYVEAQIHTNDPSQKLSRVPLSDVHSLDIDHGGPANPVFHKLGAQFQKKGVSTWHTTTESAYQPPLPFGHGKLMTDHGFEEHDLGKGSRYVRYSDKTPFHGPENLTDYRRTRHQSQLP